MRQPDSGSPKQVTRPDELTPMPRGWRLAGIVALLALAGIGLGLWQASSMRRLREAPAATVAVAWFENEDGDRSLEPLCEELPRQLQSRLAEVRGLRVLPWTETRSLRGSEDDAQKAAAGMGASVLAAGSVRRRGGVVRIGVRLVSLRRGIPVWSQTYEAAPHRAADVAAEAARGMTAALLGAIRPQWPGRR